MAELVDQETGRVVAADDADAAELVASGLYAPATPEDVQAELQRAEFSDVGSTVAAAGEGAASGISLGLSDVAIQEGILGEEFAEESRLRAEFNPTARGVGEAGGVIAGTLLTGGAGGAAALGTRAGAAAARGIGSAALKQAVTRGAGAAAMGATEGLIFGAGHELSEAALERQLDDPAALAERLAVAGGIGALLGGGLGFAGSAATSLVGSGLRAGKEAGARLLGRARPGTIADDVAGEVASSPFGQMASATDDDLATLTELTGARPQRSFAQKAAASERLDDVRQSTVRELTAAQDDIARATDANRAAFSVSEKPDTIRRLISEGGGPAAAVRQPSLAKMADLEDRIQDLVARADDFESGGRSAIRQLGRRMENSAARFDETLTRVGDDTIEEAVEAFRTLDAVKRDLGRAQVQSTRGANGSQQAMQEIQSLREDLRGFLETDDVWGAGIAGFQRDLNSKWAPLIDVESSFQRQFGSGRRDTLSGLKSDVDKTKFISEADPRKIGSMVSGLTRAETEKLEGLYRLKMAREVEYQRTASRLFGGGDDVAKNVQRIEAASKKALTALEDARQTTLDAAEHEASISALGDIPIFGGTLAGGTRLAGKAAARLRPPDTPTRAAAQSALEGKSAIRKAAEGVVGRLKTAAPKAGKAARRAGTYLGVRASGSNDVEAYQQIGERVKQLQDPESQPRRRARDKTAGVRGERPDVGEAYESHTQRAADFLASKWRDAGGGMADALGHTRKLRMDPATVSKFLRYAEAVQDPQSVLDRASSGTIRPEDVEVLREVYPTVYQDLVSDTLHALETVQRRPSYQERVRVGLMLGVPTDPSMSPTSIQQVMASAQRAMAASQSQQGEPLGGPTVTPSAAKAPEAGEQLLDPQAGTRIEKR